MKKLLLVFTLAYCLHGAAQDPPLPVVIETPVTVTTAVNYDSSYLAITILKDSFNISLLNKTLRTKTSKQIDAFIIRNKQRIDPGKILLIGDAKTSYHRFKPIIAIFKEHEYYKFRMVTLPQGKE